MSQLPEYFTLKIPKMQTEKYVPAEKALAQEIK